MAKKKSMYKLIKYELELPDAICGALHYKYGRRRGMVSTAGKAALH